MRSLVPCLALLLAQAPPTGAAPGDLPDARELRFTSGGLSLAGSLLLPPGAGPFPGVVIVHGSGTSERSNPWTAAYARAFVERGIAVLHPDKRGSGASEGNWREADFETLAGDALAGLALLRREPRVDGARVGLIGFSQGGDVVPVAAARSSEVAFVIDVSGSLVPILEQVGDEVRLMAEREGASPGQLAAIAALHDRAMHFVRRPEPAAEAWEAYARALAEAKAGVAAGLEVLEGFPTEASSSAWSFLRTVGDFDPLPHWRRLECPALFLFGGRDGNVDVGKSVRILEEGLGDQGPSFRLLFFKNNGHALFREDAMDFIARWIHDGGAD